MIDQDKLNKTRTDLRVKVAPKTRKRSVVFADKRKKKSKMACRKSFSKNLTDL